MRNAPLIALAATALFAHLPANAPAADAPASLPVPTVAKLPRWRGFNLLNKFQQAHQRAYDEQDFRLIRAWGFNCVRLPMDYRCWIVDGDWRRFDEARLARLTTRARALAEIAQAVEFGKRHGIHVMLNFHRAPGYTVAKPAEKLDIFKDAEALEVCCLHWRTFARRFKGIPNANLTFDLMNEPANIDSASYARVAKALVAAIHAEDPQRLVISDGLEWGNKPCHELAGLVAQATRGYQPMGISHYRASWIGGHDTMPPPMWPWTKGDGLLAGPGKKDIQGPLTLHGPFPVAARLRLKVGTVSDKAHLIVKADDATVWEKDFINGPGAGEWTTVVHKPEWKIYQNVWDRDYTCTIPAGTRTVAITNTSGDWMQLTELGLLDDGGAGREAAVTLGGNWKTPPKALRIAWVITGGAESQDRAWLKEHCIKPWKELEAKGVGVIVGEWGAYNKTPHDVALRWMEDCLANYQEAGWGWILWEFRGSFGIIDSRREDVTYETVDGVQVDRKMLELLQRY